MRKPAKTICVVCIHLSPEARAHLNELCEREDRSMSNMLNLLLLEDRRRRVNRDRAPDAD